MYYSSMDFDTRSLVPFLHLTRGSRFKSSIGLDLVNKHTFLLLYEELKTRSFEALASTLAVVLTYFLTIFSTGLFASAMLATDVPAELSVISPIWFDTKGAAADRTISEYSLASAALILASNLSYPSFTYQDLILPTLKVDETFLSARSNTSAVEFKATLLAARPYFANCRMFNSSQIHVNLTSSSWSEPKASRCSLTRRNVIGMSPFSRGIFWSPSMAMNLPAVYLYSQMHYLLKLILGSGSDQQT